MAQLKVESHPYVLTSVVGLDRPSRVGALLKWNFNEGQTGYSDLHPWPEWGDPFLKTLLQKLSQGESHPLLKAAEAAARWDAQARAEKKSLSEGVEIPFSHFLLLEPLQQAPGVVGAIADRGFQIVKLKFGKDLKAESKWLRAAHAFAEGRLRWRVDFNGRATLPEFMAWLEFLPGPLLEEIDYVEDPVKELTAQQGKDLRERRLNLAADVSFAPALTEANVWILKPSRQVWSDPGGSSARLIFTHALGHPLGQVHDILRAAHYFSKSSQGSPLCGLQCRHIYTPNSWWERILYQGPRTSYKADQGLGFSDLLKGLKWQKLN